MSFPRSTISVALFAAQDAVENALALLRKADGSLAGSPIGVKHCAANLSQNLSRRAAPELSVRSP